MEGLTTWPAVLPAGELPEQIEVAGATGLPVLGYPALVEEANGTVAVRLLGDPHSAANEHRAGLRRLLVTDVGLATPRITTRWNATQALTLAASPYPSTEALVTDLQLAAVDGLLDRFLPDPATGVRSATAYASIRSEVRARLEDDVFATAGLAAKVLAQSREVDAAVRASSSLALLATCTDVKAHAAALVGDGFISRTGTARLGHLARYLKTDVVRLEKAADNPERDASLAWQVTGLTSDYESVRDAVLAAAPSPSALPPATLRALADIRWMLEELRVSLFAQQLGTAGSVSPQRIRKALAAVSRP